MNTDFFSALGWCLVTLVWGQVAGMGLYGALFSTAPKVHQELPVLLRIFFQQTPICFVVMREPFTELGKSPKTDRRFTSPFISQAPAPAIPRDIQTHTKRTHCPNHTRVLPASFHDTIIK